jgi:NAD(P)-dependent dehydrogenase (short-subunit alcohol dehydrogenase family)
VNRPSRTLTTLTSLTSNTFVASGVGKACCYAFAKEGATGVVVADVDIDAAEETAAEIRALATHPEFLAEAVQLDLAAEASLQSAISYTTAIFGRVDYSVLCDEVSSFPPCGFTPGPHAL